MDKKLGLSGYKISSFTEKMLAFTAIGGYSAPVRMNKDIREILLEMIEESLSNTSIIYDEEKDEQLYDQFMHAMYYLKYKLTKDKIYRTKINKTIALQLYKWTYDNKHYSHGKEFENAIQWVTNLWNKHYPASSLFA